MCSCGIQAMSHAATMLDIRLLNTREMLNTQDTTLNPYKPEWYRFGQERSWLPAMERVCGTQKEVDGMKHSHSFTSASNSLLKQSWAVVGSSVFPFALALAAVCM